MVTKIKNIINPSARNPIAAALLQQGSTFSEAAVLEIGAGFCSEVAGTFGARTIELSGFGGSTWEVGCPCCVNPSGTTGVSGAFERTGEVEAAARCVGGCVEVIEVQTR
jgi:hypothetical protein